MILIVIIGLGFRASTGAPIGNHHVHGQTIDPANNKDSSNFDAGTSFAFSRSDFASVVNSISFVVYTFR